MADRKNITKMTTPRAVFVWPKLTEPDFGSQQYPKPDGEYTTKLRFTDDTPGFDKFRAKIEKAHAAAVENAREKFSELKVATKKKLGDITINEPFTVVYDEETEEPTGEYEMKVSMKAGGTVKKGPRAGKKWSRKPTIFDASGKPMLKTPDIWGGTEGKVSFSYVTEGYFIPGTGACGISFQLEAVQVIDLVSGGTRKASDFGFEEEEGYEYEEPAEDEDEEDEFGDETDDDDDDGAADF